MRDFHSHSYLITALLAVTRQNGGTDFSSYKHSEAKWKILRNVKYKTLNKDLIERKLEALKVDDDDNLVEVKRDPLEVGKDYDDKLKPEDESRNNFVNKPEIKSLNAPPHVATTTDAKKKMAMDFIRSKSKMLKVQREIVVGHERPPDAHYNINVTLSDVVSMDRPIPQTRPSPCEDMKFYTGGLTLSVVSPVSLTILALHFIVINSWL